MKLYEIADQYRCILNEAINEETGEINEQALAKLDEIKSDITEKGIAVASYIRNMQADMEAIQNARKEMAEREDKLKREVEWLTNYLQTNMERCGISEIKCAYFNIKLKKCPLSTDILDEQTIPDDYKKTKTVVTIDKIKIKEELLAGVVIPGVQLKQNNRIEIR